MGLFDTIHFPCQDCNRKVSAQSKGGDCILADYDYRSVPLEVAMNANRHAPISCICGASYEFEMPEALDRSSGDRISLNLKKMPVVNKLTEADRYALSFMPDGWFYPLDLPYQVKRPGWRCERLEKMGCLEWVVVGIPPNLKRQYRKKKTSQ